MRDARSTRALRALVLVSHLVLGGVGRAVAGGYDPLAVAAGARSPGQDFTVVDQARGREIPVRVYLPADARPAPVLLFSHGLGGSRAGYSFLAVHWSGRGYVVVALQHQGSDSSVWREAAPGQRMAAMRQAADLQNLLLRVADVPAVLRQLELWNRTPGHALAGRLDLARVGMSGHSFGAITAQAVSGQSYAMAGQRFTVPGVKAAVIMSPSSPRVGNPARAFGSVRIPWLLMTGTRDVAPIGNADVPSRLAVYPALPTGSKYELVLDGAEHSVFGGRSTATSPGPRGNPNHHRVILALSTAFWDAYLGGSAAARAWLDGSGPSSVLEPADRWQHK